MKSKTDTLLSKFDELEFPWLDQEPVDFTGTEERAENYDAETIDRFLENGLLKRWRVPNLNPLFIVGDPGSGKTLTVLATIRDSLKYKPSQNVLYVQYFKGRAFETIDPATLKTHGNKSTAFISGGVPVTEDNYEKFLSFADRIVIDDCHYAWADLLTGNAKQGTKAVLKGLLGGSLEAATRGVPVTVVSEDPFLGNGAEKLRDLHGILAKFSIPEEIMTYFSKNIISVLYGKHPNLNLDRYKYRGEDFEADKLQYTDDLHKIITSGFGKFLTESNVTPRDGILTLKTLFTRPDSPRNGVQLVDYGLLLLSDKLRQGYAGIKDIDVFERLLAVKDMVNSKPEVDVYKIGELPEIYKVTRDITNPATRKKLRVMCGRKTDNSWFSKYTKCKYCSEARKNELCYGVPNLENELFQRDLRYALEPLLKHSNRPAIQLLRDRDTTVRLEASNEDVQELLKVMYKHKVYGTGC